MKRIENADMSEYTSFRAGGKADLLLVPDTEEELREALAEAKESGDFIILGNGSDTLFRDGGFRGTVIKPGEGFGGNWTDFHKVGAPLYQALKRNPAGLPEMILNGGNWERDWDHGYENLSWDEYQVGECINDYYYPGYGQVVVYHLMHFF
jgi:hypothetical protein